MRRLISALAVLALLSTPVLAVDGPVYKPGVTNSDANPLPVKQKIWNGSAWVDAGAAAGGPVSAVTVADGVDATQGSTADTAYAGSGAATIDAILKGVYNNLSSIYARMASGQVTSISGVPTVNLTQIGGAGLTLGQKVSSASLPVTLASDQTLATPPQSYALLTNATASGATQAGVQGGTYLFTVTGTFGGATVQLQASDAAGTLQNISGASFTSAGSLCVNMGQGSSARATVAGGSPSGLYAQLQGAGSCSNGTTVASIADGADVAQGARSDAAYTGSGSASVTALLKGVYAQQALIVSGITDTSASHSIIDSGTVTATVSGVATAANQTTEAGLLSTISTVLGSSATAANQTTANGSLATIATNTTGASTAANQATAQASFNSLVTNTTGLGTAANQVTSNANTAAAATALGAPADAGVTATDTTPASLIAAIKGNTARINALITLLGTPAQAGGTVVLGTGSNLAGNVQLANGATVMSIGTIAANGVSTATNALAGRAFGYVWNGSSWDRVGKSANVCRVVSAAASTNSQICASTGHDVYAIDAYNTSASVRYLKLYNKAVSAPVVGTDNPAATIAILPGARLTITYPNGLYFSAGLGMALTTGVADNDTGALTAGDVVALNIYYQ